MTLFISTIGALALLVSLFLLAIPNSPFVTCILRVSTNKQVNLRSIGMKQSHGKVQGEDPAGTRYPMPCERFHGLIPMCFRTSKIARGKMLFEKSPFQVPGPPSAKTFNIWVLTIPIAGRYREQSNLKKFLGGGAREGHFFQEGVSPNAYFLERAFA